MFNQNRNLVYDVIHKKYSSVPQSIYEDVVQTGNLGLLLAIRNYKPESGKFSTYAWSCIDSQIAGMLEEHRGLGGRGTYMRAVGRYIEKSKRENIDVDPDQVFKEVKAKVWKNIDRQTFGVMWDITSSRMVSYDLLRAGIDDDQDFDIADEQISVEDEVASQDSVERILHIAEQLGCNELSKKIYLEYLRAVADGSGFNGVECAQKFGATKQYVSLVVQRCNNRMRNLLVKRTHKANICYNISVSL